MSLKSEAAKSAGKIEKIGRVKQGSVGQGSRALDCTDRTCVLWMFHFSIISIGRNWKGSEWIGLFYLLPNYLRKFMHKAVAVAVLPFCLAACGGGGGGSSDPSAYSATTAGSGSTTSTAEANGTITYSQYQRTSTVMYDKSFSVSSVSATVNFNSAIRQGSIQFPVLGVTELVTTNDGYASAKWTGPFLAGSYRFNGNILMGCNTGAATEAEKRRCSYPVHWSV